MNEAILILVIMIIGFLLTLTVLFLRRQQKASLDHQLQEKKQADELAATVEQLKTAFSALSREALSSNANDFITLAKTKFDQHTDRHEQSLTEKKKLIDARLEEMNGKLGELNRVIQTLEKQRAEAQGSLKGQVERATQATNQLQETTAQLREALASPQRRGQWGERMAEDVLRLAGFIEGVNYYKQTQLDGGSRPDFTFPMPGNRMIHMDVKFPLDNYLKVLDAPDDATRKACTAQFIRDVRSRVKEVTGRSYIDPSSGTVDYVLVFIPNEQVYGFIHENDNTLLDDAMRSKVVLCAPMTLYAILAVIRQAVQNFHLEQNSRQILDLLSGFRKQWEKYGETVDSMGTRLESAMKAFQELTGVRTRQLEKQLDKIDNLQAQRDDTDSGKILPSEPAAVSPRSEEF